MTDTNQLPPLPPINPITDHPDHHMTWTAIEIAWIKKYATTYALQALAQVQGEAATVAVDHFDNAPHTEFTNRVHPPVEIGTKLYAAPQPAKATQAEVTDERLLEIGREWTKEVGWYEFEVNDFIGCARAILALRPSTAPNLSCRSVQARLAAQWGYVRPAAVPMQPATGEPVKADSSGHLRVIASLGAALRRLSFAAQTTGGTDGPDAELQSAIGQAEQALSLGGIWQAMSATPEPAWCVATGERVNGEETYTHPAPGVPDDVVRGVVEELHKLNEYAIVYINDPEWTRVSDTCQKLIGAIDAAMLTAASNAKGES